MSDQRKCEKCGRDEADAPKDKPCWCPAMGNTQCRFRTEGATYVPGRSFHVQCLQSEPPSVEIFPTWDEAVERRKELMAMGTFPTIVKYTDHIEGSR